MERRGQGGAGRGREVLRLSLWQSFFLLFSPFSYVKSARKLGSLFATVSSVSWGGGGGRGPQAWHPSLGLKVASYCLETCVSV